MQLASLRAQLAKLRAESAELKKFNALDNERRALEYYLSEKEGAAAAAELAQVRCSRVCFATCSL